MKQIYFFTAIFLIITSCLTAQAQIRPGKKIEGQVLSAGRDNPLSGATLLLRHEQLALVADSHGRFSLRLPADNDTLIIRHIGYKTQHIIVNEYTAAPLLIRLVPVSAQLEEVVINTGYQQISKERATGSFEKIDKKLFNRVVSPDVLSRLEGISSSLYFSKTGTENELFIRGISTLDAGTAPLIVVDNFPYEGDINNINPNDIESITILKDAAAASIWGARSGNGVIVITTSQGKYNSAPKLSLVSNVTLQKKPDLFYNRNYLDASNFIDVERFLFSQGAYDDDLNNLSTFPVVSPVVEILARQRGGQLSQQEADAQIDQLRSLDLRKEYQKYFYRTAINQQYAVNFSAGSNTLNTMLSIGYDNDLINIVGNSNKRVTINSMTSFKPLPGLEIKAGINYTSQQSVNNGKENVISSGKSTLYPYAKLSGKDGTPLSVAYEYRSGFTDTAGQGQLLDWKYRPLEEQRLNDIQIGLQDVLLKAMISYRPLRGLILTINGQAEQSRQGSRNYYSIESYFSRDQINRFSQRQCSGIIHNLPVGGILDQSMSELSAYALRGQANYDGRWQDHQLTVLGGVEVRHAHHNSHSDRTYGYDDALLTFSNVDYITDFQLWDQLGYSQIIDTRDFTDLTDRFVSFYGNASYRYKRRYTATASFRKDASNLFGISTNQKWNPFWSAGLGWDLSREPFYRVNWLPALRFRITYGYNGNVKNDLAAVPTIQYNSPLGIKTNIPYANINSLPNPELRWERVNIFNAGLDFSLRDGYLEGSLEYYQKKSTDLLSPTPIDPTTGFSTMTLNSANLTGKGVDVKLKVRWIRGKFNWQTQAFFAYVRNKVSRYLKDITNIGGLAGFNYNITPIEGENPYALISYRWAGLDSLGNPVGYLDGKPSEDYRNITRKSTLDDLVIGGTTRPPFYGSLINSFSWKRFELSANIGYKFGFYFRRSSINYSSLFDSWQGNVDYTKRWQNTGDEKKTNIPSMIYPSDSNRDRVYNYSEATVEKGDFIRLQDVSISYNTGKIGLGRHAIKNIRISLYATNIGLLWRANKEGIDPDYGLGLPAPFSCSLGFKADF